MFEETVSVQTSINDDLLQLVQEIPGSEDTGENCIKKWIAVNDNGHKEFSDEDIVSMVQDNPEDNPEDTDEGEDASKDLVSHSDAASALELALRYVEQHPSAMPNDVMLAQYLFGLSKISDLQGSDYRGSTIFPAKS